MSFSTRFDEFKKNVSTANKSINQHDPFLKEGGLDDLNKEKHKNKGWLFRVGSLIWRHVLPFHIIKRHWVRSGVTGDNHPLHLDKGGSQSWIDKGRQRAWGDPTTESARFKAACLKTADYLNNLTPAERHQMIRSYKASMILTLIVSAITFLLLANFIVDSLLFRGGTLSFLSVLLFTSMSFFLALITSSSVWRFNIVKSGQHHHHPMIGIVHHLLKLIFKKPASNKPTGVAQ